MESILQIKRGEGGQVAFFVALLTLLGAGMAIGRGSADVMFLKRYGIEYLPVMYLMLSLALALCFMLYAAFVDRISSERFFSLLLTIEVLLLLAFWYTVTYTEVELVYPAYYIFYELVSELVLVHATFYIAQSLDTLQSKRLTSLILAGYQLGMIIGGLFFAMIMPIIGVEHAMLVWSGLLLLSLVLLYVWHRRHGVSPFFMPPAKKRGGQIKKAVQEVVRGLQFVRQSSLLKNSSLALFFMVLMFYVLTYSINKIYTESFESEADLAMFFGMLVAGTNLLAIIMQVFVSGRVIEKIGVKKTKLIYPLMSVLSYVLLLISPGFYMALIASVNNSSVMPAFRNPARQMFFNVLPDYVKGRARASSVALVLPLALFACGVLILYLQTTENLKLIIAFGFLCSLMYWLFCYRMGKVYTSTLIENLKKRLYLPAELSSAVSSGYSDSLYPVLLKGVQSDDDRVCLSYAQLLLKSFPEKAVPPIMHRIEAAPSDLADRLIRLMGCEIGESGLSALMKLSANSDDHLKATIYDVVLEYSKRDNDVLIDLALSAQPGRIRAAGIKAALRKKSGELYTRGLLDWYEMLQADWAKQMAVIDMQPFMVYLDDTQHEELKGMYVKVFASLLRQCSDERKVIIYKAVAKWSDLQSESLSELIKRDMQSVDPAVRSAVAACLHALPEDDGRHEYIWIMLADGHTSVRQAALQVMEDIYALPQAIYFNWLLDEGAGTPRAQKVLLETLIGHGLERGKLKQIVEQKLDYAARLLAALNAIKATKQDEETALLMVSTVLEERLSEMIDLILLAIELTVEPDIIAVVRAGLSSRDAAAVASAHEALRGIDDQRLAILLSDLIERKISSTIISERGTDFINHHEVLQWCIKHGDSWLRQCSNNVLTTMSGKVYA